MELVDSHAHLEGIRFDEDLDEVIKRFELNGGKYILNSGVNPSTNRKSLELSEKYDVIYSSFGIYPIDALASEVKSGESKDFVREIEEFDFDYELEWIEKNKDKCVAIGEVGLDYNYAEFVLHKEKQIENFEKLIVLAKKLDKPLIVHSRKAEGDAVDLLEKHKAEKVMMHCFNGKKSLIKRGVERGWYFSIPCVINRLEHFKMLVDVVPIENILTETDSPYMPPVVGERNEPMNVLYTLKEIAKIKGLSEEEVSEKIILNFKRLFNV